jgi:hypothetical protein
MTEVRFPAGARDLSVLHRMQTDSRDPPASLQLVMGVISPEVRRPQREANSTPQPLPRLNMVPLYFHSVMRHRGVVFN